MLSKVLKERGCVIHGAIEFSSLEFTCCGSGLVSSTFHFSSTLPLLRSSLTAHCESVGPFNTQMHASLLGVKVVFSKPLLG
jgi:hypothetical protein